jgi:hypothetical protein
MFSWLSGMLSPPKYPLIFTPHSEKIPSWPTKNAKTFLIEI